MNSKTAKLIRKLAAARGGVKVRVCHKRHGCDGHHEVGLIPSLKATWYGTPRSKRGVLRKQWKEEVAQDKD